MNPRPELPFASVVVPTFQRPDELKHALQSVLAQKESSWEALVIDDGQGEGIAVAEALGDIRIRALPNSGRGQVDARNTAIVMARGEYLCWLDDDDWWQDSDHLGLLRRHAAQSPALFHRGGWLVDEEDRHEVFAWSATPQSLRENNTILTSSIAYPRALHRALGLLDSTLNGYCDWDWLLRLCQAGTPVRMLPGLAIGYRVHRGGVSADPQRPEWTRLFERLRLKHGLTCQVHNHATMARELAATGASEPWPTGDAAPGA